MVEDNRRDVTVGEEAQDVEHIKKRLDMLDQRLDNIDSVVDAVVERVMNRPLTLNMVCPHCGKSVEIAVIGSEKPKK